jgi:hypothetical protein
MNLCKEITKLFRTMVSVSVETASIPDWIVVPKLCADISEKSDLSSKSMEKNHKVLSSMSIVVINILPQITQDTASKGFENVRKKGEI